MDIKMSHIKKINMEIMNIAVLILKIQLILENNVTKLIFNLLVKKMKIELIHLKIIDKFFMKLFYI